MIWYGYTYDLDQAKDYLSKAQVKVTRPDQIHIQSEFEQTLQAALLLQSDLAKLGIDMRVVKALFSNIVAATKTKDTTDSRHVAFTGSAACMSTPRTGWAMRMIRRTGALRKPPPGTRTPRSTPCWPRGVAPWNRPTAPGFMNRLAASS